MYLPYLVAIFFFLQGSPRRCNSTFIVKSFIDVSFSSFAILCHLYPSPAVSCLFVSLFLLCSKEWMVDWVDDDDVLGSGGPVGAIERRPYLFLGGPGGVSGQLTPWGTFCAHAHASSRREGVRIGSSTTSEWSVSSSGTAGGNCSCTKGRKEVQDTKGMAKSRAYKLRFELMARRCGLL
uniref:Uncharacterized protein n=2 Tax=Chromera velia CCMP2878 TaxID=1169474 RepID=A0A0G4GA27_9ALVE|eukprot:Cvel_20949.t1-p1 / transcript=Cvel_20949.t1 / gene=Cvel_20949 / organism=Chromera_velia_CCMP2878 / gene_product=hypothetical protein / transcript_product=hypothetical protein / location=Cvel_scaffold1925:37-9745(-) / protein_length=178 / sequence_SO=supercontig / SO=protein_coding / is_pseudo=false